MGDVQDHQIRAITDHIAHHLELSPQLLFALPFGDLLDFQFKVLWQTAYQAFLVHLPGLRGGQHDNLAGPGEAGKSIGHIAGLMLPPGPLVAGRHIIAGTQESNQTFPFRPLRIVSVIRT